MQQPQDKDWMIKNTIFLFEKKTKSYSTNTSKKVFLFFETNFSLNPICVTENNNIVSNKHSTPMLLLKK